MKDSTRLTLHRLFLLGSVILFAIVFFMIVMQFSGDDLDAKFAYHELDDGTIAIEGYSGVTSKLTIPDSIDGKSVSEIYNNAFAYQSELKTVTVPSSVKKLGEGAFYGCKSLKTVILSDGLELIDRFAFAKCSYLDKIELPSSLHTIAEEAFNGCTRLSELKIPSSCQKIGDDAFIACESLVLDCSESTVGAEFASRYSIPTGFADSNGETYLKVGLAVGIPIVLLVTVLIVRRVIAKKKELI